jgi:hypothetical protein
MVIDLGNKYIFCQDYSFMGYNSIVEAVRNIYLAFGLMAIKSEVLELDASNFLWR